MRRLRILGVFGLAAFLLAPTSYADKGQSSGTAGSASSAGQTQDVIRPIQLALVPPVQLVPEDESIQGVRLNLIYCRNKNVSGVDIGLAH